MIRLAALTSRLITWALVAWTIVAAVAWVSGPPVPQILVTGCGAVNMPSAWYASCRQGLAEEARQESRPFEEQHWREVALPLLREIAAGYAVILTAGLAAFALLRRGGRPT